MILLSPSLNDTENGTTTAASVVKEIAAAAVDWFTVTGNEKRITGLLFTLYIIPETFLSFTLTDFVVKDEGGVTGGGDDDPFFLLQEEKHISKTKTEMKVCHELLVVAAPCRIKA